VRDEDLDWEIYHLLLAGKIRTIRDLEAAGYDPTLVEASLSRLEKSCLIERRGGTVRPLSLQEAVILCCLKYDRESPLCIEEGVIRVRPEEERKP
jgi:hypothetical protein